MKAKNLLLFLSLVIISELQAQTYNLTTSTGTYSNLSNSISLNDGAPWDDPEYVIPIGFDFQFYNNTLNTIYIDDLGLGGSLTDNPNETGIISILTAYGADIADRAYDVNNQNETTGALSNISYKLEGSPGNRILKIEWNNVGFYSEISANGTATNFTNFQLWLFEDMNAIEIHFGPNSITDPNLVFDGFAGSSISLVEGYNFANDELDNPAITLTGSPNNPTVTIANTIDDLDNSSLNGVIPNGTIYRFINPSLGVEDFTVDENDISFYPNPASNFFSVRNNSNYKINTLTIYNVNGTKIKTVDYDTNQKIDISNLNTGLYFVTITSQKRTTTKKIMKQ